MRIFLTGATGCIGYHFARAAISQGHELLCLRRRRSVSLFNSQEEKKIEWVTDSDALSDAVYSFQPEVLFHSAWGEVRNGRYDEKVQKQNVIMSMRVLKLYSYKQVIALGSQEEYGFYQGPVDEAHPLLPFSAYGKAKVLCCQKIKEYCIENGIEWQWIRVFTIYGEKQEGGLIPLLARSCSQKLHSFDTTEGDQVYSYLYAPDFARAMCQLVGVRGKSGIYNISQKSELHSNKEIIQRIMNEIGGGMKINYGAIPYRPRQIMLMHGSTNKFEEAFGQIPHTEFSISIKNTIQSIFNHEGF